MSPMRLCPSERNEPDKSSVPDETNAADPLFWTTVLPMLNPPVSATMPKPEFDTTFRVTVQFFSRAVPERK